MHDLLFVCFSSMIVEQHLINQKLYGLVAELLPRSVTATLVVLLYVCSRVGNRLAAWQYKGTSA